MRTHFVAGARTSVDGRFKPVRRLGWRDARCRRPRGLCRARDAGRLVAGLALAAAIAGCSSLGGFAGAAAAIATGTATSNPAIGLGVGVAVKAGTDAALKKVFRDLQADEQDRIAAIAGDLAVGEERPWAIHHRIPFTDEHGTLRVVGAIDNALAACKEVLFSVAVDDTKAAPTRQWFVTQTCRADDGRWRWAAAEPAVGRWGALQ